MNISVGQRFGRVVVTSLGRRCGYRCDCGTERDADPRNLRNGHVNSCGCARRESTSRLFTTHGESKKAAEYRAWSGMRGRCGNPNLPDYRHYGGRGIEVCERWNDYAAFLADMGRRPSPQHSLDRIDVNGPYSPENCRWATKRQQAQNTRRNRFVEAFGVRLSLTAWANLLGEQATNISNRLKRGALPETVVGAAYDRLAAGIHP